MRLNDGDSTGTKAAFDVSLVAASASKWTLSAKASRDEASCEASAGLDLTAAALNFRGECGDRTLTVSSAMESDSAVVVRIESNLPHIQTTNLQATWRETPNGAILQVSES
jgi:putative Ca2+/H+ antiporter (TMEM165/GDT1 family)